MPDDLPLRGPNGPTEPPPATDAGAVAESSHQRLRDATGDDVKLRFEKHRLNA
jgi:hypothetical protein